MQQEYRLDAQKMCSFAKKPAKLQQKQWSNCLPLLSSCPPSLSLPLFSFRALYFSFFIFLVWLMNMKVMELDGFSNSSAHPRERQKFRIILTINTADSKRSMNRRSLFSPFSRHACISSLRKCSVQQIQTCGIKTEPQAKHSAAQCAGQPFSHVCCVHSWIVRAAIAACIAHEQFPSTSIDNIAKKEHGWWDSKHTNHTALPLCGIGGESSNNTSSALCRRCSSIHLNGFY